MPRIPHRVRSEIGHPRRAILASRTAGNDSYFGPLPNAVGVVLDGTDSDVRVRLGIVRGEDVGQEASRRPPTVYLARYHGHVVRLDEMLVVDVDAGMIIRSWRDARRRWPRVSHGQKHVDADERRKEPVVERRPLVREARHVLVADGRQLLAHFLPGSVDGELREQKGLFRHDQDNRVPAEDVRLHKGESVPVNPVEFEQVDPEGWYDEASTIRVEACCIGRVLAVVQDCLEHLGEVAADFFFFGLFICFFLSFFLRSCFCVFRHDG